MKRILHIKKRLSYDGASIVEYRFANELKDSVSFDWFLLSNEQGGYEFAVKVRTMNVKSHGDLQHMVGYQVRKFNACRKCLKCESLCKAGAISISADRYYIDPNKCVHCKMCVTAKYLRGGCMMDKYLRTKD